LPPAWNQSICLGFLRCLVLLGAASARAEPADLFRTIGFESPVHGGPGDLLWLPGSGIQSGDQVEFSGPHQESGDAVVVAVTPDQGVVVRLPENLRSDVPYRLVVVSANGQRSEPVPINDPRPQWISPAVMPATSAVPGAGRTLRIIGRNLGLKAGLHAEIRLSGPLTYRLAALPYEANSRSMDSYVLEVRLPVGMKPGSYRVSIRYGDTAWTFVPDQSLQIGADPAAARRYSLDDPQFGGCHANSAQSSNRCLLAALAAVRGQGGGVVVIPPGIWRLSVSATNPDSAGNGFLIAPNISLEGSGSPSRRSVLLRDDPLDSRHQAALFTLLGHNTIRDLDFTDNAGFTSTADARPILRIGPIGTDVPGDSPNGPISDVTVADDHFNLVGVGIMDEGGWPLRRLIIVHNEFAAFSDGMELAGGAPRPGVPFRIDDSIFRWNRFVPGRYTDLAARQGPIGSQVGAASRVDFSDNIVDGTSRRALPDPASPGGFRAGFFWNMSNNLEQMLISRNQLLCPGDRDGDGEALAFDADRGAENGLPGAPAISGAGADWVTVEQPLSSQDGKVNPRAGYYIGYWLQILSGRGVGQARRVVEYEEDALTHHTRLTVAPAWDVIPEPGSSRASVARLGWQLLVVDNFIESRLPPCKKSNLTGPSAGQISIWGSSADSVIDGNEMHDSSGIQFLMSFKDVTPNCPDCGNFVAYQAALEIQNNIIDGEYDWESACSVSGILGYYAAVPDPRAPPPILATGISIAHNRISHADGPFGGAIDFFPGWYAGPPPEMWTFALNPVVFGNTLSDMEGAPTKQCRFPASARMGIKLGEHYANVRGAVLSGNVCQRVATALADQGADTVRLCPAAGSRESLCECGP
jgi:hypothetical protein